MTRFQVHARICKLPTLLGCIHVWRRQEKGVVFSSRDFLTFQLDVGALLSRVVLFSLLHQTQKEGHMASSYFLPRAFRLQFYFTSLESLQNFLISYGVSITFTFHRSLSGATFTDAAPSTELYTVLVLFRPSLTPYQLPPKVEMDQFKRSVSWESCTSVQASALS